jgi:hypothetical protein
VRARRRQDSPALFHGEHRGLTENVAIRGELLARHSWEHLLDDEIRIFRGVAAEFLRDLVRAQEGWHRADAEDWDAPDHPQQLALIFEREPVAGLGFDGGGAARVKPADVLARGVQ